MTLIPESLDATGQGEQLACSHENAAPARLAETLVAFANAGGGTLLLGVDPRSGRPLGLSDADGALDRALEAALTTDPPLIIPMPRTAEIDGQPVLVVSVPPGLPHVYSFRGKYLVRDGTQNRPLDPRQLRRLMMERGTASFEALLPEGASLDDIDWAEVGRYLEEFGGLASDSHQEALLRRGCLGESEGNLYPTYAGLLLFGRDPQRWNRSGVIVAVRYAGATMADSFVREEIGGTLPEQIRHAERFVVENMRRGTRLIGLERVEEMEYPVEAIREAIVAGELAVN